MLIDFSRLLLLSFFALLRRGWLLLEHLSAGIVLPSALAQFGCARRLETLVRRLTTMVGKMEVVRAELRSSHDTAAIEADTTFRSMLLALKGDMRALQCEAAAWQSDHDARPCSARLQLALLAVARITVRVHGLADELLWELAERDRERQARQLARGSAAPTEAATPARQA